MTHNAHIARIAHGPFSAGMHAGLLVCVTASWCGHSFAASALWAELERSDDFPPGLREHP